jgi:hypothetical protein
MTVNGTFTGLTTPSTLAHIHGLADPGQGPLPVIFGLTLNPLGATSGSYSGSATLSGANLTGALLGRTYVNVHSMMNGGGEIRGQVVPAPSAPALPPWGIVLMTLSMAGAGAWLVSGRRGMPTAG